MTVIKKIKHTSKQRKNKQGSLHSLKGDRLITETNIAVVNLAENDQPQYRLGDAVMKRSHLYGQRAFEKITNHPKIFNGTILLDYANNIDRSSNDAQWQVLKNCVDRKTSSLGLELPKEDELVVHLRLGNAKGFNLEAEVMVEYLEQIVSDEQTDISLITVVTGIHFGKTHIDKVSSQQLDEDIVKCKSKANKIIKLLQQKKLRVRLISTSDIDSDFCYLANATMLVLGNGNFSLSAAKMHSRKVFVPPWTENETKIDYKNLFSSLPF